MNEEEGRRLLALLESDRLELAAWDKIGSSEQRLEAGAAHLKKIGDLVDIASIRARGLKVVLDCNHGAGNDWGPKLLESLGCEVTVLGGRPDGLFEHPPEPTEANLTGLVDAARRKGADVCFAQDPDADRLAIVDNTGRYIGEELTLALCADFVLARRPGPVVVNGSTSRVTADIAARAQIALFPVVGRRSACCRQDEGSGGCFRRRGKRGRDRTASRLRAR